LAAAVTALLVDLDEVMWSKNILLGKLDVAVNNYAEI
jgi:hypothetical protein